MKPSITVVKVMVCQELFVVSVQDKVRQHKIVKFTGIIIFSSTIKIACFKIIIKRFITLIPCFVTCQSSIPGVFFIQHEILAISFLRRSHRKDEYSIDGLYKPPFLYAKDFLFYLNNSFNFFCTTYNLIVTYSTLRL